MATRPARGIRLDSAPRGRARLTCVAAALTGLAASAAHANTLRHQLAWGNTCLSILGQPALAAQHAQRAVELGARGQAPGTARRILREAGSGGTAR